ncbi:MAG: hypothetical protein ABI193_22360 [Minicystis sp.]
MNTRSTTHLRLLGTVLGAFFFAVGCERIADIDRSKIDGTGGGGGGTTSSTGGGGSAPECAAAEDCADPGSECLIRACTAEGKCVPDNVAAGTKIGKQKAGDCQQVVCDGAGAIMSDADDNDLPVDGKECTTDTCKDGVPSHTNLAVNQPCGAGGALYCDGDGACVGCVGDAQCGAPTSCATPKCALGACITEFTQPGTAIPAQTTGDCQEVQCDGLGGTKSVAVDDVVDDGNACTADVCLSGAAIHPNAPSGTACAANGIKCDGAGACVICLSGADCQSLVCTGHSCIAATCADGVKNATETDADCGGPGCAPCADTLHCAVAGDCTSLVCSGSPLSCQAPLCTDTVKNGTETDVDCGSTCAKCATGKACMANADCKGNLCTGNTCVPTCTDTVKNGTETDVDCGGSCAAKCGTGKACGAAADCASALCTAGLCQAPSCIDNVKNGAEPDVDCGGPVCGDCADGKGCAAGGDCVSGVCTAGACTAPACNDNVKNGAETDKDCGGPTCAPCIGGQVCLVAADCVSAACTGGFCAGFSCLDNLKNGLETDVDCGGGTCPTCANGKVCALPTDCTTGICTAGLCAAPPTDDEPANNTCAGASPEPLPANISGLQLPNVADVDWFMFTATAADVGKKVRVKTTSTGSPPCDTVVQVFVGSCAALVSLGGESDDLDYSENWLSTPLPAAGAFWVKVSYSPFGFSSAPYTLIVTTE